MKIRVLFRQIQQVPYQNRLKQMELEHRSDLASVRMGLPLPQRMRPLTGNMDSRVRIQEREFETISDFTKLYAACENDPEWQRINEEWKQCYDWQRQEILYVDDINDPIIPWIQMAAEQQETIRYTVNPNYKMPTTNDTNGDNDGRERSKPIRFMYRQTQLIPFEKWLQEVELERKTDEEEARLGHPLPRRYRYFSGAENSQIRVHERVYDDFEHFGEQFEAWADDEVCQKIEVERHNFYEWEREELLYVDDPIDIEKLKNELRATNQQISKMYL